MPARSSSGGRNASISRVELEKLRFAGDWLFYALLIKSGKISFRRKSSTSIAGTKPPSPIEGPEDTQANESLSVKASVFESILSPAAISASLGETSVFEYAFFNRSAWS